MRFVSAVALALAMLWVPVDGVAQTQAERRLAESYETRARQIMALINPAADRADQDALLSSCVARAIGGAGRPGGIGAGMAECTDRMTELGNQQAARRNSLQQQAFQVRQQGLEILARTSPPPPPQPEARGAPVTVGAGDASDAIDQFLNRRRASPPPTQPLAEVAEVRVAAGPNAGGLWNLDDLSRQGPQYLNPETLEPYSGPAYRTSEDDPTQIVLRVNLRDGRFHGDFEDFELEGDSQGLYQTGTYRDGQLEGPYEVFYPSGVLRGRGTHGAGERDGPYESYHENGELRNKSNYTDGEQDGPYENYYESGQLSEKGTYVAGALDGLLEAYEENGQLQARGTFNMGEQCGEWLENGEARTYPPC